MNFEEKVVKLLMDNLFKEDGKVYIYNKLKYEIFNLVEEKHPQLIREFEEE